jgi:hypothetical protein
MRAGTLATKSPLSLSRQRHQTDLPWKNPVPLKNSSNLTRVAPPLHWEGPTTNYPTSLLSDGRVRPGRSFW